MYRNLIWFYTDVGKEQISQDGMVSLSQQLLALAQCFVNNVYVTVEITYSIVHVHHKELAWSQGICLVMRYSPCQEMFCAVHLYEPHHESPGCCYIGATLGRHHDYIIWCYVTALLWLCSGYVVAAVMAVCNPGERLCCGYSASQERINISAVPMAPRVSFQPLNSCFTYLGFNKQCGECEQWDNRHRK